MTSVPLRKLVSLSADGCQSFPLSFSYFPQVPILPATSRDEKHLTTQKFSISPEEKTPRLLRSLDPVENVSGVLVHNTQVVCEERLTCRGHHMGDPLRT